MDFLKARFGVHVVLITDPAALAVQMDLALNGEDGRSGPFLVEGRNVEYNKDALITDGRTADKLTDLAWIQKPERFSAEREFRFCLHATGLQSRALVGEADYFKIILGTGKLSHAQLLEVPPKHKMHQMAKDTAVRKATGSRRGHKGKNGPRPD
jgi:hypothetical protein